MLPIHVAAARGNLRALQNLLRASPASATALCANVNCLIEFASLLPLSYRFRAHQKKQSGYFRCDVFCFYFLRCFIVDVISTSCIVSIIGAVFPHLLVFTDCASMRTPTNVWSVSLSFFFFFLFLLPLCVLICCLSRSIITLITN